MIKPGTLFENRPHFVFQLVLTDSASTHSASLSTQTVLGWCQKRLLSTPTNTNTTQNSLSVCHVVSCLPIPLSLIETL